MQVKMAESFRSFVMLTNANVTGKYRYRDKFQLLPAPAHFPRAPYSEAHHPCLLEVKYDFIHDSTKLMPDETEVPDWIQRKDQERKAVHEIMSLFSVFSFSKFVYTRDNHSWTIRTDGENALEPEWRQLSYFVREHQFDINEFTNAPVPEIEFVDTAKFYNLGARYVGSDFSVPDLFEEILDAYYGLDQDSKHAILRSATLFTNAKRISPSISFTSFVSSIESLVDYMYKGVKIEKCKECSAPRYSVTKKFTEFLKTYSSDSDELIRFYKEAYGQRSKILHAGALFLGEHIPTDWAESDWESYHMISGIERICRIAFSNWVLERYRMMSSIRTGCSTAT
jgi:hypothetical protein